MAALTAWLAVRNVAASCSDRKYKLPTWDYLRHMVVLGTTNGWLANVLTAVAVRHADSAVVAMIQATVPLMVVILAHFLFVEEKFKLHQLAGVSTGLVGILLIIGPLAVFGGGGTLIGIGAMLLTAFCYASGTVYGRRVAGADPVSLACGQQAFGALVASAISVLTESVAIWNQSITVWLLLATLGVMCSAVPTVLYLKLLARTASVLAALVAYLQPVWATLLGWVVLGEHISAVAILGTGLVFVAIMVTTGPRVGRGSA